MPGKYGFDFNGASQSFNVLAEYLFGKVADVVTFTRFMSSDYFLRQALTFMSFCVAGLTADFRTQRRRGWR